VNTLVVFRFDGPEAADATLPRLRRLAQQHVINVDDAALVSWLPSRRKPATRELGSLDGPGELWGGFWGLLLGLVFLSPLAGPAFGAAAGAVAGGLSDFGIEDDFIKSVRDTVIPGTSAVFVVTRRVSADRLTKELRGLGDNVGCTYLSPEQEQRLRDALGDESTPR
jgi:uncharacterized membrane protein